MKKTKNQILAKNLSDYLDYLKNQPNGFVYNTSKEKDKQTKKVELEKLYNKYKNCQECPLANQGRIQVVFGQGNPNAKLMFVGEGPGKNEDAQGVPFVGKAGHLLTKIFKAMKLERSDVYISNVVKCRPPNNRTPMPNESQKCKSILLFKEIEIIKPKIICTLGSSATQALLGDHIRISKIRGIFFSINKYLVMPTFHPAYLLRNPNAKKDVWQDMKKITKRLE
ncbi:uracil-DNA glycosylase [Candidatus Babeliales bacterium]|nr:uracil-DNA glycosylase [Candidatus Babeliales bacterium]